MADSDDMLATVAEAKQRRRAVRIKCLLYFRRRTNNAEPVDQFTINIDFGCALVPHNQRKLFVGKRVVYQ